MVRKIKTATIPYLAILMSFSEALLLPLMSPIIEKTEKPNDAKRAAYPRSILQTPHFQPDSLILTSHLLEFLHLLQGLDRLLFVLIPELLILMLLNSSLCKVFFQAL